MTIMMTRLGMAQRRHQLLSWWRVFRSKRLPTHIFIIMVRVMTRRTEIMRRERAP